MTGKSMNVDPLPEYAIGIRRLDDGILAAVPDG
jgi:hypothetical protein